MDETSKLVKGKRVNQSDSKKKNQKATQKKIQKSPMEYIKVAFMIMSGFAFLMILIMGGYLLYKNITQIDDLRSEVVDLKSAMNTDSVRQHKLQKVIQIIKDHNESVDSETAYDISNTIHEMSIKYTNLDIDLLCAVITHESANTWDPEIVSPAGAMGLMQIMPVTGMFLAEYEEITWTGPEDVLFNPVYNIRMGSRYLSSLIEEYDLEAALAAYNGGERIARVYLANGKDDKYLWAETQKYIPAIKALYENYLAQGM